MDMQVALVIVASMVMTSMKVGFILLFLINKEIIFKLLKVKIKSGVKNMLVNWSTHTF